MEIEPVGNRLEPVRHPGETAEPAPDLGGRNPVGPADEPRAEEIRPVMQSRYRGIRIEDTFFRFFAERHPPISLLIEPGSLRSQGKRVPGKTEETPPPPPVEPREPSVVQVQDGVIILVLLLEDNRLVPGIVLEEGIAILMVPQKIGHRGYLGFQESPSGQVAQLPGAQLQDHRG